jgi:penicillin-binding protein 2
VEGVLLAGKTGTAQVRRITMAERNSGGVRSNASLAWKMRDHSLFVGFAPADKPRYACAVIVEHGGWGASVAAPACRDVLTYLFDKQKAMAALAPLEEQWGGSIADRLARRREQWRAATPKNDSDEPPPPTRA